MDRETDRGEGLWEESAELENENSKKECNLPKIEEKAEPKPPSEQPTVCGECRAYLAQISAQATRSNRPVTTAGWIGVNFLMMIPLVNVLFLFLWACGGTERINLKNYARGILLTVVLLVLFFLVSVVVLDFCGIRMAYPDFIERLLR